MTVRIHLSLACLLSPFLLWPQQANVNLDYNPQKNTENLIPFSATLNSPDVRDDGTVTFRLKAPAAKEVPGQRKREWNHSVAGASGGGEGLNPLPFRAFE